jgi:hypothetical protein
MTKRKRNQTRKTTATKFDFLPESDFLRLNRGTERRLLTPRQLTADCEQLRMIRSKLVKLREFVDSQFGRIDFFRNMCEFRLERLESDWKKFIRLIARQQKKAKGK